jgi:hypothetical protein
MVLLEPMLRLADAVPKKVPLAGERFDLDLAAIEAAIGPRTRLVIVDALRREMYSGGRPPGTCCRYACVDNRARVISGSCTGQWGRVTGKHGGINHVMVDFPTPVLRQLQIGDRIQVYSCGLGLRLADYPEVAVFNCAPALLRAWGIAEDGGTLSVPATVPVLALQLADTASFRDGVVWQGGLVT